MTDDKKPPAIYGIAELAERWGVTRQRASQITRTQVKKGRLGPPADLKCGPVWIEHQIQEFEANWPRETGKKLS